MLAALFNRFYAIAPDDAAVVLEPSALLVFENLARNSLWMSEPSSAAAAVPRLGLSVDMAVSSSR